MNKNFTEMGLSPKTLKAIEKMGFTQPTPIQSSAIPTILKGKDIIGQAHTGTGKTATFAIPMLEQLDFSSKRVQALVLCPTRELAVQVTREISALGVNRSELSAITVYGGQPIERQIRALKKGVQIVVGTPGRLMDHMRRGTLKLDSVNYVVLDEADEMLNMGFLEDIEYILGEINTDRQTVLFSATMPRPIVALARKFQKDPELIRVVERVLTVPTIEQYYLEVKESSKTNVLSRLIDYYNLGLSLVFCNTKKKVDELVLKLQEMNYSADGLHGDMSQSLRDRVMKSFRNGSIKILVATDVAARGIDVDNIDAVFNYDVPDDEEYYVHRIGRTGRAGKTGMAFSFAYGRSLHRLREIERYTKIKINKMNIPSSRDIKAKKAEAFIEEIGSILEQGNLGDYVPAVETLINRGYTSLEIAAALIKLNLFQSGGQQELESPQDRKMVKLVVNAGKKHNIRARDLVGAITGEAGISGDRIGAIKLLDKRSYVEIEQKYVELVIESLNHSKVKGNRVSVQRAS
ncbi:MAG: ATP-dependent helicase [Thermotogae bacterium]|nr:MAG: ATP-dependent helicase [Thermotogota bacterium]